MACLLTSGVTKSGCDGFRFGGLEALYIANFSEVDTVSRDSAGQVTGITMSTGATFYSYEFETQTGQALEELQADSASKFVNQTINFQLGEVTQAKKETLEDLALADTIVIAKDNSGQYKLYGDKGRGLASTVMTFDTGTADGDANFAQITLVGGNRGFADTVDGSIVTGLL